MTNLSIQLPDDMVERLKRMAKTREVSLNELMLDLALHALAKEETKQWFVAAQLRGNSKQALRMLDELDGLGPPL